MVLCYNRGCGKDFDPQSNTSECKYHPGEPVFHDAYKSWSCCGQKSTDFTIFLNYPGCTTGKHTNVKPPTPEKPPKLDDSEVIVLPKEKINKIIRPPRDTPKTELFSTETTSLKEAVEKEFAKELTNKVEEAKFKLEAGEPCKNSGCREVYPSTSTCLYHSGVPIFHEGLKYWSCCIRKTSDFNAFMEQAGCKESEHCWKKSEKEKKVDCRIDWFQTGTDVVISVFAKLPLRHLSTIEASPIVCSMTIVFGREKQVFEKEFELWGIVNIDQSKVTFTPNKIEITFKKELNCHWEKLFI